MTTWTVDEETEALRALSRLGPLVDSGQTQGWVSEQELHRELVDLGWVIPFDWVTWRDGAACRRLVQEPEAISEATSEDLRRLITMILRQDRYELGYLAHMLRIGVMERVVERAGMLVAEAEVVGSLRRPRS